MDKINHITMKDYQTKPWKNGKGTTHDIFLFPENADHSNFDLRFALSPIVEDGIFSAFPGADRVITVIEGDALTLEFDTETKHLKRFQSLHFDTGLTPMGKPMNGSVKVVNVMARRNAWQISKCEVTSELNMKCHKDDIMFLFALGEQCKISFESEERSIQKHETVIVSGGGRITADNQGTAGILYAHLKLRTV